MIRPPFLGFFKKACHKCPPGVLFIHRLWIIHVVIEQKGLAAKALGFNRGQVFGKGDKCVDTPAVFDSWLVAQAARGFQLCASPCKGAVAEAKVPLQLVRAYDKFRPPPSLAAKGGHRTGVVTVHQVVPEHIGCGRCRVIPVPAVKFLYLTNIVNGQPPFPKTGS